MDHSPLSNLPKEDPKGLTSDKDACEATARILEANPADIPFSVIYLLDDAAPRARLVATTGAEAGRATDPDQIELNDLGERSPTRVSVERHT